MKYILGFILIMTGIILSGFGYFMNNRNYSQISQNQEEIIQPIFQYLPSEPSPKPSPRRIMFFADITQEFEQQAVLSLSSSSGILKEIFPSWYVLTSSGSIRSLKTTTRQEITQISSESGIAVNPTVTIEWITIQNHFLSTNEKKFQTIGKIVDLVEKENYAGINIDMKNIPKNQYDNMITMWEKLCDELQQRKKKCYTTINNQRKDSSGNMIMIIPFSTKIQDDIQQAIQNNIQSFSFQFLGDEDPSVWTLLSELQN
ncbi:MAG: hypothetical protein N3A54_03845 [Patescibacteria group bacterium]|nr:hypothetical protein [Patescibacteria group bacterium]